MPVNWKEPDAFSRLLAAMVAAQDMKVVPTPSFTPPSLPLTAGLSQLDYRKIATYYGNNATYDSIEGRFRIIKREAAVLKAEIDSGSRPEAPPRGNNTPVGTPKKPRSTNAGTPKVNDKTLSGRVNKNSTATPTKKSKVKAEEDGDYVGSGVESFYSVENGGTEGQMDGAGDWSQDIMDGVMGRGMMADPFDGLDVGV